MMVISLSYFIMLLQVNDLKMLAFCLQGCKSLKKINMEGNPVQYGMARKSIWYILWLVVRVSSHGLQQGLINGEGDICMIWCDQKIDMFTTGKSPIKSISDFKTNG